MSRVWESIEVRVSELASSVAESATMKFNDRANRLRAEGKPVIHLGIGEPKNKAPEGALIASSSKLEDGHVKYTPAAGLASLRRTIADYMTERYEREIPPDNVVASNGSKHALFNVLMAIVNPGDRVLIPVPYWVSYPEMVKLVRGEPTLVPPAPGTLQPDFDSLVSAVDNRTVAILLNTPNNPSGMVYKPQFVQRMVEFCEEQGVYLVMDDIYRELVFEEGAAPSAYGYTSAALDESRVVLINGVSKLYGMTGFRLGWSVAPVDLTSAIKKLQGQMTSNPSVISQVATEGALTGDQTGVGELREHLAGNLDLAMVELAKLEGLAVERPQGGLYCFPDFSVFDSDSLSLANFLLEKALVVTVPGVEFGMEGHLRIGLAGTREDLEEGLKRIHWALDPNSPPDIQMGGQQVTRDWVK